jgi:photosystem II stability/assembly factor-like uncharacterized protein
MQNLIHHPILKIICTLFIATTCPLRLLQAQWFSQTAEVHENLVDIAMLDSTSAIAIGNRNAILRTTDSGSSWVNETIAISAAYYWNSVSFSDRLHGAIIGNHRLITTTDGGINWQLRSLPSSTQSFLSVMQFSYARIYAGTDSGWIYTTSDTGNTWLAEKASARPIRSLFFWRGLFVMGLPVYALTPNSLCSKMEFPPEAWHEMELQNFQGLGSEAFNGEFAYGGGPGYIVGVYGDLWAEPAIIRHLLDDTTWYNLPTGNMGEGQLNGVSAPSEKFAYVCGDNGRIFKSTNGGESWSALPAPTTKNLRAIYFFGEKHGFVVGDSGTILYTSNGGEIPISVKENKNVPAEFGLSQNYPNPFNPTTSIKYQLPGVGTQPSTRMAGKYFVSLRVYDMLGRSVATLVNEQKPSGIYSVQWNAEGLSSGIYFYRIQAGNFSETKKLILLR